MNRSCAHRPHFSCAPLSQSRAHILRAYFRYYRHGKRAYFAFLPLSNLVGAGFTLPHTPRATRNPHSTQQTSFPHSTQRFKFPPLHATLPRGAKSPEILYFLNGRIFFRRARFFKIPFRKNSVGVGICFPAVEWGLAFFKPYPPRV